jgi:RNA-directed DNA polymerase
MKAGVLEDGEFMASERGTGQGSVISPLLANIYLHYAFDLWANRWRQREATSLIPSFHQGNSWREQLGV